MSEYVITSAQYQRNLEGEDIAVWVVVNGEKWNVPMTVGNRHYDALLKWVAEGNTIADAD